MNFEQYFWGKGSRNCLEYRGRRHGGMGGHEPSPNQTHLLFCVVKRKKGSKGKEERVSKQKLSKSCHQSQNVTPFAILERLEFKNFSCRPTIFAEKIVLLFCNVCLLENGS